MAGDHSSVRISSRNEARNSPSSVSTNGSVATMADRPMSQMTIVRRRSHRSISTPPTGARKNPGTMRAAITRPTAAELPCDTRAASATTATRPIQSPRLETTWAIHSRK